MKESQRLRDQSARCSRLARDATDPEIIDSLQTLAIEFAEEANAMDRKKVVWQPQP